MIAPLLCCVLFAYLRELIIRGRIGTELGRQLEARRATERGVIDALGENKHISRFRLQCDTWYFRPQNAKRRGGWVLALAPQGT